MGGMLQWLKQWLGRAKGGDDTMGRALGPEERRLLEKVQQYTWYHRIKVAEGVYTPSAFGGFAHLWDFILRCMEPVDYKGKAVLDIGCRDGLFSFEAERRGAASVLGIDNDLSPGAVEFLIPHFKSMVRMEALNLYDLDPARHGPFDIIEFYGVLYHLRYPFWGLKKIVDVLKDGGILLIESGMLKDAPATQNLELLYCPVATSPYEPTSCTFFNKRALVTTLESFGLELTGWERLEGASPSKDGLAEAERQFFEFRKKGIAPEKSGTNLYWDSKHAYHSVEAATDPNLEGRRDRSPQA